MSKPKEFLESLDSVPIDIDAFFKSATKDLYDFVKNIKHLKQYKGTNLSLFHWYVTFGRWNESLNFFERLGEE